MATSESSNLTVTQDPPAVSIEKAISSVGQTQTKCAYCDELCPSDAIDEHQENCGRKVFCEACGEMIIIDILDYHLEVCTPKVGVNGIYDDFRNYQDEGGQYLLELVDENRDAYDPENEEGDEDQDQDYLEEGEDDDDGNGLAGYNQNGMTYEQLIALDENIVKKGMTPEELESYPITIHSKESDAPSDCNVCISEFEDGESLRRLPCGHKFHKDCVDTWLEANITCPVCKKYLR